MSPIFQYRILKYIHSDVLGESLNVGILFFFPNDDIATFKYPKSLLRIKNLYLNNLPDKVILSNLKGIAEKCKKTNPSEGYILGGVPLRSVDSIAEMLIPEDSTSLRFEQSMSVVQFDSIPKIVENYYEIFFKYYELDSLAAKRNDEEFISKQLKGYLRQLNPSYQKYIQLDAVIKAPILPDGEFAFDFAWNNHVIHYVKPLSFDLAESKSINAKAAQYYGYLSAISGEIGNNKVDIVTSVPQKRSLWTQYEKALEMIDKVSIEKEIIEQDNYKKYAQLILESGDS